MMIGSRRRMGVRGVFLAIATCMATQLSPACTDSGPSSRPQRQPTGGQQKSADAEKKTATSAGPITVHQQVPDATLRRFLYQVSAQVPRHSGDRGGRR